MGGIKSFSQILSFVIAQTLLLSAFITIGFWRVFFYGQYEGNGLDASAVLIMMACALLALRMVWPILIEPVEAYWGTSAKVRVRKWLLPSLQASISILVIGALATLAPLSPIVSDRAAPAIAALSIAAPLIVTSLLLYSALRRRTAIRKGIDLMRDAYQSVGSEKALSRVSASLETEEGTGATTVRAYPQGFTFAGLSSKPWHDPTDFPWLAAFVSSVDDILAEAMSVLKVHETHIQKYDYVGLDGDFWQSFKFVARHEEIAENIALCPKTAALLKTIPGYPCFRDAMFSILGPGGLIKSHRDVSNVFLTLHLPLVAPGNGYIEVGGMRREWRKGEPLVFDSSYNHQAENKSAETRIVLLVDFPHPDLSGSELEWVHKARL